MSGNSESDDATWNIRRMTENVKETSQNVNLKKQGISDMAELKTIVTAMMQEINELKEGQQKFKMASASVNVSHTVF